MKLKTVSNNTKHSAEEDNLCYTMFRKLPEVSLKLVLKLFNKNGKREKFQTAGKEQQFFHLINQEKIIQIPVITHRQR